MAQWRDTGSGDGENFYQDLSGFDLAEVPDQSAKPQLGWTQVSPSTDVCCPAKRAFHHVLRAANSSRRLAEDQTFLLFGGECEPKHRGHEIQQVTRRPTVSEHGGEHTADSSWAWEWRASRESLKESLLGSSVATLGNLVFIFGGLRLNSVTGKSMNTDAVFSNTQISGELSIFDSSSGQWRGVPPHDRRNIGEQDERDKQKKKTLLRNRGAHDPTREPDTCYFVEGEYPTPRFEHASVALITKGNHLIVHGGRSGKLLGPINSLHVLQVKSKVLTWRAIHFGSQGNSNDSLVQSQARKKQFVRKGHTLTAFPGHPGRAAIFGGRMESGEDGRVCAELMLIDVCPIKNTYSILANNAVGPPPPARIYHCACVVGCFFIIFGGRNRLGEALNDLYLLHVGVLIWSKIRLPTDVSDNWPLPRWGSAAVKLERSGKDGGDGFLIFGGAGAVNFGEGEKTAAVCFGDAWLLSFDEQLTSRGIGPSSEIEAFQVYPDTAVLSMWDRLHMNVSHLGYEYVQKLTEVAARSSEIAAEVVRMENLLASVTAESNMADKKLEQKRSILARSKNTLETEQQNVIDFETFAQNKIAAAELEVTRLREHLGRVETTCQILEVDCFISPENISRNLDEGMTLTFLGPTISVAEANGPAPGSFGEVWRFTGSWCGTPISKDEIKLPPWPSNSEDHFIRKARGSSARQCWETTLATELRLAARLRHPNLVETYGGCIIGNVLALVYEPPLVPLVVEMQNSYNSKLEGRGKGRLAVCLDVAMAIEYLHCRGIVHRRLSLFSVFLRDSTRLIAKIGDLLPSRVMASALRECACEDAIQSRKAMSRSAERRKHRPPIPNMYLQLLEYSDTYKADIEAGFVDPRPADIFAFGFMVLQIFASENGCAGMSQNSLSSAVLGKIQDRTIRLIVMRCMDKESQNRMSASIVARALEGAMRGDAFFGLDLNQDDLSKHSTLIDFRVDQNVCDLWLADGGGDQRRFQVASRPLPR